MLQEQRAAASDLSLAVQCGPESGFLEAVKLSLAYTTNRFPSQSWEGLFHTLDSAWTRLGGRKRIDTADHASANVGKYACAHK